MAGDWLKVEACTPDKPEVWGIADALDLDPDAVVGKLLRVWIWFNQQTETGNAPSVTKMLLDRQVGVTGFCGALITAGWMHESDGNVSLPNFDRHNGESSKKRALTARRVAKHKRKTNKKLTQEVTLDALPREEKRREEETTPKRIPVKSKKSAPLSENFNRFWLAYPQPRRKEKPKAWAAWKAQKCELIADDIIAKLEIQKLRDRQFLENYEPFPERYLKNRKFEDEIDTRPPNGKSGPIPAAEARRRAEQVAQHQPGSGGRTFDESGQEVFP